MSESVMRQKLETWLKDECIDLGFTLIDWLEYIDRAYIFASHPDTYRDAILTMEVMIPTLRFALPSYLPSGVYVTIRDHLESALTAAKEGKWIDTQGHLVDAKTILKPALLEKVVECQIGKST